MLFDYFLLDAVKRDDIRKANNAIVLRADEIWIFGPVSNGVLSEILIAQDARKKICYFKIQKPHNIVSIDVKYVEMEENVIEHKHLIHPSEVFEIT